MDGVITAIVAFLLACLVWPHLVKNRSQYYAAFGFILLTLLIQTLAIMFSGTSAGPKLAVFGGVVTGVSVMMALVMCLACAGGVSVREIGKEVKGAYEVIRRGETEKEVIIPLRGHRTAPTAEPTMEKSPPQRIELEADGTDRPVI